MSPNSRAPLTNLLMFTRKRRLLIDRLERRGPLEVHADRTVGAPLEDVSVAWTQVVGAARSEAMSSSEICRSNCGLQVVAEHAVGHVAGGGDHLGRIAGRLRCERLPHPGRVGRAG